MFKQLTKRESSTIVLVFSLNFVEASRGPQGLSPLVTNGGLYGVLY